jgi:hypothetical protein
MGLALTQAIGSATGPSETRAAGETGEASFVKQPSDNLSVQLSPSERCCSALQVRFRAVNQESNVGGERDEPESDLYSRASLLGINH